jgi:hypothetical protein
MDGMKKVELRAQIHRLGDENDALKRTNEKLRRDLAQLNREVETMRAHWRPVADDPPVAATQSAVCPLR